MVRILDNLLTIEALILRFNFNIIVVGIIYLIVMDTLFPTFTDEHSYTIAFIGAIVAFVFDRWSLKFWRWLLGVEK
ncbi:MAG: hypothetical protein J6584_07790 [Lactobacillus sp.]|uniref:hypothetical protein n=1 Tax=Bombilactobacillus bombi TaxID=1303590 RepID=UPI0035E9ED7D|nr:hypothetical protein [Lactobacillus sp.]